MGDDLFKQKAAVIQPREETREGQAGRNWVVNPLYVYASPKPESTSSENQQSQITCHLVITDASLYGIRHAILVCSNFSGGYMK
jgi:hypothetical protein